MDTNVVKKAVYGLVDDGPAQHPRKPKKPPPPLHDETEAIK